MQKACAGLAGKPCCMDCWLNASSVPWHSNILIDVWFRQGMRLVRQFITIGFNAPCVCDEAATNGKLSVGSI